MKIDNICIAVFDSAEHAQGGLKALADAGYPADKVSLVGKDHADDKHVHGYHTTGDAAKFWGGQGAIWGGVIGTLAATGFVFVPGIGPLLAGGPLLSVVAGAAEGAAVLGGIEALFGGLLHLTFSKESLVLYEKRLKQGKWLLLAHGDTEQVVAAKHVLRSAGSEEVALHCDS